MQYNELKSPNGQHKALLKYEGEIRFGPTYHRLFIDGKEIENRIFGSEITWDSKSNLLATQEWLTCDYLEGPITRVALFDLNKRKISFLKPVEKGFVCQFTFVSSRLIFKKEFTSTGIIKEVEVNLNNLNREERY